tara:strand:- start:5311 stop:6177 length:867 start_codon:yes stop_codon:yes gene_type:complete
MMKNLIALLALSLIFSSCEKEIDYQIPNPGDKIVVSGRLENGLSPKIYISTSVYSMLAREPKTSNIYTAKLYSDAPNSPFELLAILDANNMFDSLYYYTTANTIEAGKNYRLEVSAPNLDPVSAQTGVPDITLIENVRFDTVTRDLRFNFRDKASTSDYYIVELRSTNGSYPFFISTADPSLEFFNFSQDPFGEGESRTYGTEAFLDDNQFNGQGKEINIRLEDFSNNNSFYVYLHSISESYYRFRLTQAAGDFNENPFSEPVQIFSNVSGGYGVMAGTSSDSSLVRF